MSNVVKSKYFLDHIEQASISEVHQRLQIDGLVFFRSSTNRQDFFTWFSRLFQIVRHPDSAIDGITEISASGIKPIHGSGAGFSNGALPLHIDGSSEPIPPPILCLLLVASGKIGGSALLSDGLQVYRWCQGQRDLQRLLSLTSQAMFRNTEYPIFDPLVDPRSMTLRFRQDALLRPTLSISEVDIRHVAAQLNKNAFKVILRPGEGYLLHNHRWAHGRSAFTGSRLVWRLLGSIRPDEKYLHLNDGFMTQ